MLTGNQISLLQSSWKFVEPLQNLTVGIFYTRLFPLAPELRSVLPLNILGQKELLLESVKTLLSGLDHVEYLALTYGQVVIDAMEGKNTFELLELMAEVWITTLRIVLDKKLTTEMENAWYQVFFDLLNYLENTYSTQQSAVISELKSLKMPIV